MGESNTPLCQLFWRTLRLELSRRNQDIRSSLALVRYKLPRVNLSLPTLADLTVVYSTPRNALSWTELRDYTSSSVKGLTISLFNSFNFLIYVSIRNLFAWTLAFLCLSLELFLSFFLLSVFHTVRMICSSVVPLSPAFSHHLSDNCLPYALNSAIHCKAGGKWMWNFNGLSLFALRTCLPGVFFHREIRALSCSPRSCLPKTAGKTSQGTGVLNKRGS